MRRNAPRNALLLTALGVLGLGGPLVYRALHLEGEGWPLTVAAIAVYALWMAWESRISVAELDREAGDLDRGTMEMCAAAKIILLAAGLLGGGAARWDTGAAGLAALLAGVALRSLAIRALGASYSHRIRLPERLHTDGVYRLVRHPAYAGTLLAHAAIPLVLPNPFALAAYGLLWLPAVVWRTHVEDRLLRTREDYAAYAAGRARLIPWIW